MLTRQSPDDATLGRAGQGRAGQGMPTFSAPDGTTSRWRNSIWACLWQDLWTGVGWWWADLFFQSLQQHSFAMTKTACVERSTICHLDQLSYSYRCWERWGWPWMPEWAVFPTNTQGLSLSVIVGDCRGGREVEQGEKKNTEWIRLPRESQLTWSRSLRW